MNIFGWFASTSTSAQNAHVANPLSGRPMRYLIGADGAKIKFDFEAVMVLPYDYDDSAAYIVTDFSVGYCNLYWQDGAPDCAPYLSGTDTARQYSERVIDPNGPGWARNLHWQFARWKKVGVHYVELDNPDGYHIRDVILAIDLAATYGLKVLAKNPQLLETGRMDYLRHPNVYGATVEQGAGDPHSMDVMRHAVGKLDLPVWFVSFGESGKLWADGIASIISSYRMENMRITHSADGEYTSSTDI